jgi:multiple RNA-binding domain-containing protein 1
MSLAETRLVNETRAFLERNGVVLDAFSNPNVQRSDTVMIAKNLPAGIDEKELKEKFEKFGDVKRFLLPPGKY